MEINPFASFATEKPDIFPLPEGLRERLTRERFLFNRKRERTLYLGIDLAEIPRSRARA